VKLRTNVCATTFPGIETWTKHKLSKRNYHSEYAELLSINGFPPDNALQRNERVEVLKVRKRKGYFSGKEVRPYSLHVYIVISMLSIMQLERSFESEGNDDSPSYLCISGAS
jgi:hypothetical protein